MRPATRDALLWLAGLGGAAVLLRTLLDILDSLLALPPMLAGVLLALAAACVAALAMVRRRLGDGEEPVAFTEERP